MIEHKHALLFVGGIATAIVGKKILESQTTKDYAAKGMAKVLTYKSDLEENVKEYSVIYLVIGKRFRESFAFQTLSEMKHMMS